MLCNEFRCVYMADGECIGDMCENWGECIKCQQRDKEECEGLRSL